MPLALWGFQVWQVGTGIILILVQELRTDISNTLGCFFFFCPQLLEAHACHWLLLSWTPFPVLPQISSIQQSRQKRKLKDYTLTFHSSSPDLSSKLKSIISAGGSTWIDHRHSKYIIFRTYCLPLPPAALSSNLITQWLPLTHLKLISFQVDPKPKSNLDIAFLTFQMSHISVIYVLFIEIFCSLLPLKFDLLNGLSDKITMHVFKELCPENFILIMA